MNVSVIITTYNRPTFLKETIDSILAQSVLPSEIIIGDDSQNDDTENMINNIIIPNSIVPIQYYHHKPSLKEVKNVDFIYTKVNGDLILHMHDDDPIYPNCIEYLLEPFLQNPEIIASFGLQRILNEDGSLVENAEYVNSHYFRTAERAGIVDGFQAGACCMFPNNGFMVKKTAALKIGYSDGGRAGKATDFYFGFRLGKLGSPFFFVNKFTSTVRMVADSQSRNGNADNAYRAVKILLEDCKPEQFTPELKKSIRNKMPIAISIAAQQKDRKNAFKWLFSEFYRDKLLTPRGIKRILQTIFLF